MMKIKKALFLYGALLAMTIVLFWGNKITAKADYYFTLENNILSTTSLDKISSQWTIPFPIDCNQYSSLSFNNYCNKNEKIHLEIRGVNSLSHLTLPYDYSTLILSGDGMLTLEEDNVDNNGDNIYNYISVADLIIDGPTIISPHIDCNSIAINSGNIQSREISCGDFLINNGTIKIINPFCDPIFCYGFGNKTISINGGLIFIERGQIDAYGKIFINGGTLSFQSVDSEGPLHSGEGENGIIIADNMICDPLISTSIYGVSVLADGSKWTSDKGLLITDNREQPIDTIRYETEYVDPGYELTEKVPTINIDQPEASYELVSRGKFSEFKDLYLDGNKLTRDVDYTAVAGSTRITIKAQTLVLNPLEVGQQHSLMLEFRTTETNELRTASQLFTVTNNAIEAEKLAANQPVQETVVNTPVVNLSNNVLYGTLLEDGRYLVGSGDNLSRIAKEYLEMGKNWTQIYQLNKDIIKDPNLIYKGQIFKLH